MYLKRYCFSHELQNDNDTREGIRFGAYPKQQQHSSSNEYKRQISLTQPHSKRVTKKFHVLLLGYSIVSVCCHLPKMLILSVPMVTLGWPIAIHN